MIKKECMFYKKLNNNIVQCEVCPRKCIINEGKRGVCKGRENINGTLYAINYGKVCSMAIDPIEKKPLFHFHPNSPVFSIATGGCNFKCLHCQNWQISQSAPDELPYNEAYPEDIIKLALNYECKGIAYTYTEPTIFYELMYDTAKLGRTYDLYNVMITNGYIEKEPLKILPIDGMNIDIKGNDRFYKEICKAEIQPVLETAILSKKLGIHVEITNLIVPTYNDDRDTLLFIIDFVKDYLGRDTPLHFTAFHPAYKLTNIPPTPLETLIFARNLAIEEGLKYVYVGNVLGYEEGENTYCPNCGTLLIERFGFTVSKIYLNKVGNIVKCPNCGEKINIIM